MPRVVRCGLIQASTPKHDGSLAEIKEAMIQKHLPLVEEAGKKGVQILCLQELFHGPYFAAEQDIKWYRTAEPVPGPITERMAPLAKKHRMVMIVPVYEMEQEGVYYNTAQVIDEEINKLIKEKAPKGTSSQTQGESIRVSAKKRDALQDVIAMLKAEDVGIPLQFQNFRD